MNERGRLGLLSALAAACLVYDPAALASEPKRSLGLCCAMLVLAWVALRKLSPPRLHPAQLALFACIAWLGLRSFEPLAERAAVLGNWALLFAWTVLFLAFGRAEARAVGCRAALVICVVSALWLGARWLAGARGMQLHAGQGNPNWLGLVLAAAWPLAWSDAWLERRKAWLRVALGGLVTLALALAESRVAWVAAGFGWLAVCAFAPTRRSGAAQLAVLVLGIGAFLLAASASGVKPAPVATTSRAVVTRAVVTPEVDHSARTSLAGRVWIQKHALTAAFEALPAGRGVGSFYPAFLEAQGRALERLPPKEAGRRFSNATSAHQDFIELAVEAGPLAALLLLTALLLAARAHLREREAGFVAALVAVFVAALGDSPLHLPAVCLLLAVVFAALPTPERGYLPPRAFWFAPLLAGALLLPRSLSAWFAERLATEARAATPTRRAALLERAQRMTPDSGESALALGLDQRERGDSSAAVSTLERAARQLGDVASFVALGSARLDTGDSNGARSAFEGALMRNPGSVRAHSGLAEALRRALELDLAERHAQIALQLLPGDAEVRARLDAIREQRMDQQLGFDPAHPSVDPAHPSVDPAHR